MLTRIFCAYLDRTAAIFALLTIVCLATLAADKTPYKKIDSEQIRAEQNNLYKDKITPFLEKYCFECHDKKSKGDFSLRYAKQDPGVTNFRYLWKMAAVNVDAHDMPPEKKKEQPTDEERAMFTQWVSRLKHLSPKDPGEFVIRRLTKIEYANTLHDLFGVEPTVADTLPAEVFGAGYTNTVSPLLMEQFLVVANTVLDQIIAPGNVTPTSFQNKYNISTSEKSPPDRKALQNISRAIARKAYRRPATAQEIDVLLKVYDLAKSKGKSQADAIKLLLKAVMVSPQFLFITPDNIDVVAGGETKKRIVPLGDHQLASRLSYLLWATMPDDELMTLADKGVLHQPDVLKKQVQRLIADPRSRALFDGFGAQWLGLNKLADKAFDEEKFPLMTADMRVAMYEEARLFFEHVMRENRPVSEFITANYTYMNKTLARVYGLEKSVNKTSMQKIILSDANRGGILTMPGILAVSSFPNRTSPVNRGVYVLEYILGEHTPPAPADVPPLEQQDVKQTKNLTLRQRTELHRTDAVCANCHKILDPIGFGLENFDAIGQWRDTDDSGGTIDATGELPGNKTFSTPKELKKIIAARQDDLCHNVTERLLAYALCRTLEGYDELVVDELAEKIARDGYGMQSLIIHVVTSYPFINRTITY